MISRYGRGSTGLSGKWVGRHLSGEPKFDIPFSVFPAVQHLAIFICGSVYYKLSLILIPRKASLMRQYPSSRCVLGLNLCGDKEHEKWTDIPVWVGGYAPFSADMKCISGERYHLSAKLLWTTNQVLQDAIAAIQIVSFTNSSKISWIFYGIKLGLKISVENS